MSKPYLDPAKWFKSRHIQISLWRENFRCYNSSFFKVWIYLLYTVYIYICRDNKCTNDPDYNELTTSRAESRVEAKHSVLLTYNFAKSFSNACFFVAKREQKSLSEKSKKIWNFRENNFVAPLARLKGVISLLLKQGIKLLAAINS